jgi:hypothetical protein
LNLLRLENEYKVNPDIDPTEFIKLYQKFRTYPIFQVGLKVGMNHPLMSFGNTYESTPGSSGNAGVFTLNNGLNAGLEFEIPLRKLSEKIELCPSLSYSGKSYDLAAEFAQGTTNGSIGKVIGTETEGWLELPVMVRYLFHSPAMKPFVELGPSVNYLLSANFTKLAADAGGQNPKPANIDLSKQRNMLNYGIQLGGGTKFDIAMAEIVIKADFNYSLNQLNIRNIPRSQSELDLYNLHYVEPDFKINSFTITIGYIRKIYKPKKIFE